MIYYDIMIMIYIVYPHAHQPIKTDKITRMIT